MSNTDDNAPASKRLYISPANLTQPSSGGGVSGGAPTSQQSFTQKIIQTTIQLAANSQTGQPTSFAGTSGSNSLTLAGFRTRARIDNSGGVNARASVTIFGVAPSTMNQLSTLGMIFDMVQKNTILVEAGSIDASGNPSVSPVFNGTIVQAFGYYNDLPNASLHLECQVGQYEGVTPVSALSFAQSTDVATMLSGLARTAGFGFENNGVSVQLPPSYFPGTARDQIRAMAEHAHINAEILPGAGGQQVLAIWPMGGSRTSLGGQNIPVISKDTGMILTPAFAANGFAVVRSLFNPQVAFGGVIQVQSGVVPQASRAWVVQRMSMALDAYIPKGKWEMSLVCYPKGFTAPVPPNAGSN